MRALSVGDVFKVVLIGLFFDFYPLTLCCRLSGFWRETVLLFYVFVTLIQPLKSLAVGVKILTM